MTLNLIKAFKITRYNTKHTQHIKLHIQRSFFVIKTHTSQRYKFIEISFIRLLSWPAFGGPKILVYIYTYISFQGFKYDIGTTNRM